MMDSSDLDDDDLYDDDDAPAMPVPTDVPINATVDAPEAVPGDTKRDYSPQENLPPPRSHSELSDADLYDEDEDEDGGGDGNDADGAATDHGMNAPGALNAMTVETFLHVEDDTVFPVSLQDFFRVEDDFDATAYDSDPDAGGALPLSRSSVGVAAADEEIDSDELYDDELDSDEEEDVAQAPIVDMQQQIQEFLQVEDDFDTTAYSSQPAHQTPAEAYDALATVIIPPDEELQVDREWSGMAYDTDSESDGQHVSEAVPPTHALPKELSPRDELGAMDAAAAVPAPAQHDGSLEAATTLGSDDLVSPATFDIDAARIKLFVDALIDSGSFADKEQGPPFASGGTFADIFSVGDEFVVKIFRGSATQSAAKEVVAATAALNSIAAVGNVGPNLVRFHGCVFQPQLGVCWIMEKVQGRSLRSELDGGVSEVAVPWDLRSTWLRQVATAMKYLHANHIQHGDLRAANVLMSSLDVSKASALVTDVGQATLRNAVATRHGGS
eukprot:gene43-1843_t